MTQGQPRQGDPRVQREEPAAERASACGSGRAPARRSVSTRIRLADTQKVIAIAEMSDGTFWSDSAEVDRHARGLPGGSDDMSARALINVPPRRQARRGDRDQDADLARHGDRLPPRHQRAVDPARHHHVVHLPLQRRGDLLAPSSIRRSPRTRSSRSTRSRPRAARSPSPGRATTGSRVTEEAKIAVE